MVDPGANKLELIKRVYCIVRTYLFTQVQLSAIVAEVHGSAVPARHQLPAVVAVDAPMYIIEISIFFSFIVHVIRIFLRVRFAFLPASS